jgi:threonine dehydrogenase-like Zn-dependent dehydrogenase
MSAERMIAMSRHEARQKLALEYNATDIVTERGDDGAARVKDMTKGIGADSILECVGTERDAQKRRLRATDQLPLLAGALISVVTMWQLLSEAKNEPMTN